MTRYRPAQRDDSEPWTVTYLVSGPDGGVEEAELHVAEREGMVVVQPADGTSLWFTVGAVDELVHLVLLAANRASYHSPQRGPT